ncbi:MAG: 2-keto-4-pentenoate hydratase [Alphaproteobacteria bacterium]
MALDHAGIVRAADLLYAARSGGKGLDTLPEELRPQGLAEAEAIRDALFARLGGTVTGWKIGFAAPSSPGRPGYVDWMTGPMIAERLYAAPARLKRPNIRSLFIEAEFGFRMTRGLPLRGTPYSEDEIAGAAEAICGLELAGTVWNDPMHTDQKLQIADMGVAWGYIPGPPIPGWRERDMRKIGVEVVYDGKVVSTAFEGDAQTDAFATLVGMVARLARRGEWLRAGWYVTTGAAAMPKLLGDAREVVVRWDGIGEVRATFE